MNLLHLRYIQEIERTGNITKASRNLFMGQSNLSKAVKELEAEIGITIFKRTGHGVEVTKQGAEFLSYARVILSQVNELESRYQQQKEDRIKCNIAVPRATYISIAFTEYLKQIAEMEKIEISFKETNSISTIHEVACGDCDIGVIRYEAVHESDYLYLLNEKGLRYEPLFEFYPLILMSRDNPLAKRTKISLHELNKQLEIVHGDMKVPNPPFPHARNTSEVNTCNRRISVCERCSQFDMLQHVANTFMWVSPIPVRELEKYGLVLKECTAKSHLNKDLIIYAKDKSINHYEKLFMHTLEAECKRLVML